MSFTACGTMIVLAALLPASMLALSALVRRSCLSPELARKLLHVEMGLTTLSFPGLIRHPILVLALSAAALGWLYAVRRCPPLRARFGPVLTQVGRQSAGDLYFVCGTCLTYLLAAGRPLNFYLPMTLLIFADSAAALVGTRHRARRHRIGIGAKTVEGCAAFFAVALVCGSIGLTLGLNIPAMDTLAIAVPLAFDTAALELMGKRGGDNLLVPLGAGCLLPLLLQASPLVAVIHLLVITCLLLLYFNFLQRIPALKYHAGVAQIRRILIAGRDWPVKIAVRCLRAGTTEYCLARRGHDG